MTFGFRVCFRVNAKGTLTSGNEFIPFNTSAGNQALKFSSGYKDVPIEETDRFSVSGEGFDAAEAAAEAAASVRHALLLTFIRTRHGLDLGQNSVQSFTMSPEFKEQLAEALGSPAVEDRLGVTVFSTDPKPRFIGMTGAMIGRRSADALAQELGQTIGSVALPTDKAETAAGLYGLSHFVGPAPARFLLLVIALEALLDPAPRSNEAIAHVDSLIAQTQASSLTSEEKAAICSTLAFAKRISINEAGKRLAEQSLGSALYDGLSSRDFFTKVYKVRSDLVHRGKVDPTEMHQLVGEVDRFVAEILEKQFVAIAT